MKRPNHIFATIARKHLFIPTLKTRRSDSLDFHNVAVWQIEAALNAAFDAGTLSARKPADTQSQPREQAFPGHPQTPLLIPTGTPLIPGKLYLRLYHGRTDPAQEMDEWGFAGPTFGPLSCYVHTYCCTFRMHGESDNRELWLETHADMIQWGGCFYGDMELFIAGDNDRA